MNNFRKTTWEDAVGRDVWIKWPDGTMEKLTWTGDCGIDENRVVWVPGTAKLRRVTPYVQTTDAVEITLHEAVERAEQGLRVEDEDGDEYGWDGTVRGYINWRTRYFIPAVEPEAVEVTVTLPAALRDDFLKGVSAFAGAKVKE